MERAKSDEIVRQKCLNYIYSVFGNRVTPFYMTHAAFAKRAADLACELYCSRGKEDNDYICSVNSEDIVQHGNVIWAAGLLSYACYAGNAGYDDVCDVANPEVADYLKWVNPDKSISLLASTQQLLSQLHVKNSCYECGPIFVVLARALAAMELLQDDPYKYDPYKFKPDAENTAYAAMLWHVRATITQLINAQVYKWSTFVFDRMKEAMVFIKAWDTKLLPSPIFRSGENKSKVEWILSREVPPRYKDEGSAIEC